MLVILGSPISRNPDGLRMDQNLVNTLLSTRKVLASGSPPKDGITCFDPSAHR